MIKNRCIILLCVLCITAALVGCGQSPTPDPVDDPQAGALSAYRSILEAAPALEGEHEELSDASFGYEQNLKTLGEHYDSFALSDLDQNGVPELIVMSVVNFRWSPVSVYTYADGAAVLLHDPLDAQSPVTYQQNSSANGAYTLYFCADGHIHSLWRGAAPIGEMEENHAYALEGTVLVAKDCPLGEEDTSVSFSDIAKVNSAENRAALTQ